MARQKWVAISFCLSFIFVYLCFIAYVLFPILFRKVGINLNLPQSETTIAMNTTISSISAINSMGSWTSMLVFSIVLAVIIFIIANSIRTMGIAYAE